MLGLSTLCGCSISPETPDSSQSGSPRRFATDLVIRFALGLSLGERSIHAAARSLRRLAARDVGTRLTLRRFERCALRRDRSRRPCVCATQTRPEIRLLKNGRQHAQIQFQGYFRAFRGPVGRRGTIRDVGRGLDSAAKLPARSARTKRAPCYVASVGPERDPQVRGAQLTEIVALVQNQGGRVVGREIYQLSEPNPRTLLGKGSARGDGRSRASRGRHHAGVGCGALRLANAQLEDAAGIAVCDREAIILNVVLAPCAHAAGQDPNRDRSARIPQAAHSRGGARHGSADRRQQERARPGETASELLARKLGRALDRAAEGPAQARNIGENAAPAARRVPGDWCSSATPTRAKPR